MAAGSRSIYRWLVQIKVGNLLDVHAGVIDDIVRLGVGRLVIGKGYQLPFFTWFCRDVLIYSAGSNARATACCNVMS